MANTYMPLWNIYDFDKTEGTFTLTENQKYILANAEIIRISYHILAREYEYTTTTTISSDGYATVVKAPKDTYYF